jgi:hypothetical protein
MSLSGIVDELFGCVLRCSGGLKVYLANGCTKNKAG